VPPSDSPSSLSSSRFVIAASTNGTSFQALPQSGDDGQTLATLDAWIEQQPQAVYEYWLRMETTGTALPESINRIALHTYFQFAPRSLVPIAPGDNEIELFIEAASDTALKNWDGLDVEITWNELFDDTSQ
jgi:hypothetical protein